MHFIDRDFKSMVELNNEYRTTDTPLAAYLVQQGFDLLIIEYEDRPNGRKQATFVFDSKDPKIKEYISLYNRGIATINLAQYEHVKVTLIDKIMRGIP